MSEYYLNYVNFDDAMTHAFMLADIGRVNAYLKAIKAHVKPGMRVLELGAGLGVFGRYAATLGAEVTLVDYGERIVEYCERLNKLLGPSAQITTICSDITEISLQPHDLVIHEMFGGRLLDEGVRETLKQFQANNPWSMMPGIKYLPDRGELWAAFGQENKLVRSNNLAWLNTDDPFEFSSDWHLIQTYESARAEKWNTDVDIEAIRLKRSASSIIWGMRLLSGNSYIIDTRRGVGHSTCWGSPIEVVAKKAAGVYHMRLQLPTENISTYLHFERVTGNARRIDDAA